MDFLFDPEVLSLIKNLDVKNHITQVLLVFMIAFKVYGFAKKRRKNKRVKLTLIKGGKMEGNDQKQDGIDTMQSAYDMKVLAKELEGAGLDGAEVALAKGYPVFKKWLKKSATLTKTVADDVAVSFVDQADAIVLPQIDKINGKIGA